MRPGTARPSRVGFLFVGYFAFSVGWALALWPSSDAARTFALSSALIGGALLTGLETIAPGRDHPQARSLLRGINRSDGTRVDGDFAGRRSSDRKHDRASGRRKSQRARTALCAWRDHNRDAAFTCGRVIPRLLAAGGTLILVIAIIDTFSRSSYLAFAAVSVLLAVSRGRKMFILVSGACAVVVGILPDVVLSHLGSGLGLGSQGLRPFVRDTDRSVGRRHQDDPGLPAHRRRLRRLRCSVAVLLVRRRIGFAAVTSISGYAYAHNLPLTILASGGVVGLILAAGFASRFVRPSGWRRTFADRANLVLVSVAVASLFGEPLLTSPCLIACLLLVKRAPHESTVAGPQPLGSP